MGSEIEIIASQPDTNLGCYLMRIKLRKAVSVRFGAYRGGKPVHLRVGHYVYLGSARGHKGASSLGNRLLRHATRTADRPPHAIRPALHSAMTKASIPARLPSRKSLHWHIDYLLDRPESNITHVLALRTDKVLESHLADWLADRRGVSIPATGLGASDHPGSTHLLTIPDSNNWWIEICSELAGLASI
jgi:Uri superfamily endonuclease